MASEGDEGNPQKQRSSSFLAYMTELMQGCGAQSPLAPLLQDHPDSGFYDFLLTHSISAHHESLDRFVCSLRVPARLCALENGVSSYWARLQVQVSEAMGRNIMQMADFMVERLHLWWILLDLYLFTVWGCLNLGCLSTSMLRLYLEPVWERKLKLRQKLYGLGKAWLWLLLTYARRQQGNWWLKGGTRSFYRYLQQAWMVAADSEKLCRAELVLKVKPKKVKIKVPQYTRVPRIVSTHVG